MAIWTGAVLAVALLQAGAPPGPAVAGGRSNLHAPSADGFRPLELRLGERVVLTFDAGWQPTLVSVQAADPADIERRLAVPIDLQTPETPTAIPRYQPSGGSDPRPLNHAAKGTVAMTLIPYQTGTLLLVENGLDKGFRYHAATLATSPDGRLGGRSTTLCPVKPVIGTVETWAARYEALAVVRFEAVDPSDQACRA